MSSAHPSADSAGTQPLSLFALTHSFTTTQSRALAQSRSFSRRGRDVRSHSHILHSCFARTHTHTHKHTHTRMHTNTHTHACKSKTADVPARCAGFLEPSTLDTHTPQAGHTHTHTQSHIHTHIQTHTHACMHKQDGRRTRSLCRISGAIDFGYTHTTGWPHTHTHTHAHTHSHIQTHAHACTSRTADVPARCAGFLEPSTLEFPHSCEGFVRPSRWPRDSGQNLCAQCVII